MRFFLHSEGYLLSFDETKCVANCITDDENRLFSKNKTHCVEECNAGKWL